MLKTPIVNYRLFQRLHPLSLLAQLGDRKVTGCLRVINESISWSIYLENGKLIYAASSHKLFDRIENHLQQLNQLLSSTTNEQMRLIWEKDAQVDLNSNADYRAICWLVEQNHLTFAQAAILIEEISKEVLESFLCLKTGSYKFNPDDHLYGLTKFCQMDLHSIIDYCQKHLRHRQSILNSIVSTTEVENKFTQKTAKLINFPKHTSLYTIACIDDSPTVLNSIKFFLDESRFSLVMINDPIKALMQIIRSKPDLILLDIEMPDLNGYELCSLLRKNSGFRNTPIVMVTGKKGFIDQAKAKIVRSSGYLTKPFTRSELLKMITKYIG